MDDATAAAIREASRSEAARREHPTDVEAEPPLSTQRYTDSEIYRREQQHVFRESWLMACHLSELAEPGSALALSHLPVPVIVVRDRDSQIRVFANSCRHRGSTLLDDGCHTSLGSIVCPYHAWAYRLDGRLAGVPEAREFRELDRERLGLRELRSASWGGFVWINPSGTALPFREWLGGVGRDLDEDIATLDAETSHVVLKQSYEVACNWKLAIEANLETYHVNALHRKTAAGVIDQRTTTSTLLERGHSRMFLQAKQKLPGELPLARFESVHALGGEGVLTYSFFPNVALVVSPQLLFTTNAWPIDVGRTHYELYFIAAEPKNDANRAFIDLMVGFNVNVIEEDVRVLAGMQRSYDSGSADTVHFSYAERRLGHLRRAIDEVLAAAAQR